MKKANFVAIELTKVLFHIGWGIIQGTTVVRPGGLHSFISIFSQTLLLFKLSTHDNDGWIVFKNGYNAHFS